MKPYSYMEIDYWILKSKLKAFPNARGLCLYKNCQSYASIRYCLFRMCMEGYNVDVGWEPMSIQLLL
jgi:hypothetical protein